MPAVPLQHVVAMGGSAGAFSIMLEQVRRLRAGDHACLFLVYHRAGGLDFRFQPFMDEKGFQSAPAETGTRVEANALYHPHLSDDLEVHDGALRVAAPQGRHHPSIDRLFSSLAATYGQKVIAVLLSGYSTDGLEGLRQVRAHGGRTIVQDPADAAVPDLPARAVEAGLADRVLPAAEILDVVSEHLRGRQIAPEA